MKFYRFENNISRTIFAGCVCLAVSSGLGCFPPAHAETNSGSIPLNFSPLDVQKAGDLYPFLKKELTEDDADSKLANSKDPLRIQTAQFPLSSGKEIYLIRLFSSYDCGAQNCPMIIFTNDHSRYKKLEEIWIEGAGSVQLLKCQPTDILVFPGFLNGHEVYDYWSITADRFVFDTAEIASGNQIECGAINKKAGP